MPKIFPIENVVIASFVGMFTALIVVIGFIFLIDRADNCSILKQEISEHRKIMFDVIEYTEVMDTYDLEGRIRIANLHNEAIKISERFLPIAERKNKRYLCGLGHKI